MRCTRCGKDLGRSHGMYCPYCGQPVYLSLSQEPDSGLVDTSTNPERGRMSGNTDEAMPAMSQVTTGSSSAYKVPQGSPAGSLSGQSPAFDWSASSSYPSGGAPPEDTGSPAYRFDIAPTIPISPPKWGGAHPLPTEPRKPSSGTRTALIVAIVLFVFSGLALTVYAVSTAGRGATPTATVKPTATPKMSVVVQDSLAKNNLGWPKTDHCFFQNESFHIKDNRFCYAGKPYSDARITVQTSQLSGPATAPYGIVYRVSSLSNFYGFEVSGNGSWFVWKCASGNCTKIVTTTQTTKLQGNLGQINTLSVLMQGDHFVFYINDEQVGTAIDDTYTSGNIGLEAGKDIEVSFTNLTIAVPQA